MYRDIFQNVYRVIEQDGTFTPTRFTNRQLAALGALHPNYERFGRCAAGVSLAFYTSSPEVSFDLTTDGFYTRFTGVDFYENGVLMHNLTLPEEPAVTRVSYEKRTAGETLLEIYLPSNARVTLTNLSLGDFRPVDRTRLPLILYYGDSLTQSAYTPTPSLAFPSILARETDTRFVNRGIGSLYFDASTLDPDDGLQPKVVFAEFGGNDLVRRVNHQVVYRDGVAEYYTPAEVPALIDRAEAYLTKLRKIYSGAVIIPITLVWCYTTSPRADIETVRAEYYTQQTALCRRMGFDFIDGSTVIPHLPQFRVEDGTHFNALGAYAVAASLLPRLLKAIR
ncbi:MAG: SGNH/GDSL hydrolase family protein [Clostridiales bacterium]|nr:SGNH/GDSL hydrolase family protein [Clostridiales bacterium]